QLRRAVERVRQEEKEKTDELEHQVRLAQRQAQINVQNLRRRYNPVLTRDQNEQLDRYVQSMGNLTATTPNVRRHIQNLNQDFKQISANVAEAGAKTDSFGHQLRTALTRVPIWINTLVQVKPS